jgi:hypothetical protein
VRTTPLFLANVLGVPPAVIGVTEGSAESTPRCSSFSLVSYLTGRSGASRSWRLDRANPSPRGANPILIHSEKLAPTERPTEPPSANHAS